MLRGGCAGARSAFPWRSLPQRFWRFGGGPVLRQTRLASPRAAGKSHSRNTAACRRWPYGLGVDFRRRRSAASCDRAGCSSPPSLRTLHPARRAPGDPPPHLSRPVNHEPRDKAKFPEVSRFRRRQVILTPSVEALIAAAVAKCLSGPRSCISRISLVLEAESPISIELTFSFSNLCLCQFGSQLIDPD